MQIKDGTGKGFLAKVNKDNQLVTRAVSVEQRLKSALNDNYFEVTTGIINLANAVATPILYLKNDNVDKSIIIDRVFYDTFTSVSGVGSGKLLYVKNPTIAGGTDIVPNICNFGSNQTAEGTFKKSLTTMTGTTFWTASILEESSAALEEGRIVLPVGSSIGIIITAPTSNTDMDIAVNIGFYYFDIDLVE